LVDNGADGFVRVKPDLAIFVAPDEAYRQAAPEFAARRLVPDAAIEAGTQHVQFRFAHRPLEPEQQTIIEQRGMIETIGIADQRVSETGEIDEAIPFGIVACQTRDFEAEHKAHPRQCHFGDQSGEAGAGRGTGAGKTEILVDDDPFGGPTKLAGLVGERVLLVGRFAVVLDLSGARLTQIDNRLARKMAGRDLGALTHRSPPPQPS
jgi:hypothetical protein